MTKRRSADQKTEDIEFRILDSGMTKKQIFNMTEYENYSRFCMMMNIKLYHKNLDGLSRTLRILGI